MALLAVCSAALTAPVALFAQDAPPPPPPPPSHDGGGPGGDMAARMHDREQHQLDRMTKQLGLSDAQVVQVKQAFADSDAKIAAAFSDPNAGGDRRSQMMALRQDREAKVRAVLTPDQQTKYDAMQAEMRDRGGDRGGRGPGGPGGDGNAPPPPPPAPNR
jgi:periplasmic protein CpxP/Spy